MKHGWIKRIRQGDILKSPGGVLRVRTATDKRPVLQVEIKPCA